MRKSSLDPTSTSTDCPISPFPLQQHFFKEFILSVFNFFSSIFFSWTHSIYAHFSKLLAMVKNNLPTAWFQGPPCPSLTFHTSSAAVSFSQILNHIRSVLCQNPPRVLIPCRIKTKWPTPPFSLTSFPSTLSISIQTSLASYSCYNLSGGLLLSL